MICAFVSMPSEAESLSLSAAASLGLGQFLGRTDGQGREVDGDPLVLERVAASRRDNGGDIHAGAFECEVLFLEDVALREEKVPLGDDDRVAWLGQDDGLSESRLLAARHFDLCRSGRSRECEEHEKERSEQLHLSPPVMALSSPVSIGGPPRISSLPDASTAVGRRRKRPMKIARSTLTM